METETEMETDWETNSDESEWEEEEKEDGGESDWERVEKGKRKAAKKCKHKIPNLVLLDSYKFFASSLSKLGQDLACSVNVDNPHEKVFPLIDQHRKQVGYEEFFTWDDLSKKSVFPYSLFVDETFLDTTALPSQNMWIDDFTEKKIDDESYAVAKDIWEKLERWSLKKGFLMTMKIFHNYYLEQDVLILASVVLSLSNYLFDEFQLDIASFVTLASFTWAAFMKYCRPNLEQLTDQNMFVFFEESCLGGIVQNSKKKIFANNKEISSYDSNKPLSYITFMDANSLYATSMGYALAHENFKFYTDNETKTFEKKVIYENLAVTWSDECAYKELCPIDKVVKNVGLTIKCDLSIPDHLHEMFNSLPPIATRLCVKNKLLSPMQKKIKEALGKGEEKIEKIVLTLGKKRNVVLDYRLLKLYIDLGIEVRKIKRVVSYYQSTYLNDYIKMNGEKRRQAKTKSFSHLIKAILNLIYGKSLANKRDRLNVKMVLGETQFKKEVNRGSFVRYMEFSETCGLAVHQKKSFYADNPVYIASNILSISKLIMFRFYYQTLLPCMNKRHISTIAGYLDTDSFLLYHEFGSNATDKSIYPAYREIASSLDVSTMPESHPFFNLDISETERQSLLQYRIDCAGVFGLFKNECPNNAIEAFLCHKSKAYLIRLAIEAYGSPEVIAAEVIEAIEANGTAEAIKTNGAAEADEPAETTEASAPIEAAETTLTTEANVATDATKVTEGAEKLIVKLKGCMKKSLKDIRYSDFLKVLMGEDKFQLFYNQTTFRTKNHDMTLVKFEKACSNKLDDKRYLKINGNDSFAFSHCDLKTYDESWKLLNDIVDRVCLLHDKS